MKYTWGLPPNDTSPQDAIKNAYNYLLENLCDSAEQEVTQRYGEFSSPRNVLLFMAGVHLCRGDKDQAQVHYDRALAEYGLAGLSAVSRVCEVYKSVASVLEQAPRESFACPDGTEPGYREGPNGEKDNPLTPEDESLSTGETSTAETPAPAGEGQEETGHASSQATATDELSVAGP